MAGAESTRLLPTLRLFKIGVQFDMEGKSGAERSEAAYSDARRPTAGPDGLRPVDIAVIRELQEDLPLVPQPFAPMAERVGIAEEEFFAVAGRLKAHGYMRRMAAVLRHREAGFRANAMGVWVVPAERAEEVGRIMGSFTGVSHCYLRPTYPDWPYSIFTMVHGQDAQDCQEVIDAIAPSDRHRRVRLAVQHQGVQEDPAAVLHARAGRRGRRMSAGRSRRRRPGRNRCSRTSQGDKRPGRARRPSTCRA